MNKSLHLTRATLLLLSIFLAGLSSAQQPYRIFKGTTSPNGGYALAWGATDPDFDPENPDESLQKINFDSIQNYLVNLKTRSVVAQTGTHYFETPKVNLNHASIMCLWRQDSAAVIVIQDAKWETEKAILFHLDEGPGRDGLVAEPLPLTNALKQTIVETLLLRHPEHAESIRSFAIRMVPLKWSGKNVAEFRVSGEVPKAEDTWFFEDSMTFKLPGPLEVRVATAADAGGASAKYEMTPTSAAGVRLGMTAEDARKVLPSASFSKTQDGEGIDYLTVESEGKVLMRMLLGEGHPEAFNDPKARITSMQVISPLFATADGLHVGMSGAELSKRYGPLEEIYLSEIETREYARFSKHPRGVVLRMRGENGTAGVYPDGKTFTKKLKAGARVTGIEIVGAVITDEGSIAGIKLGATQAQLMARAKTESYGELFKGEDQVWEAIGEAVQTWVFPDVGLAFDMASREVGRAKTVISITAKPSCKFPTGQGVKVGDPIESITTRYSDYPVDMPTMGFDASRSTYRLIGSIYGGMSFHHKNGLVTGVFLGAMAE